MAKSRYSGLSNDPMLFGDAPSLSSLEMQRRRGNRAHKGPSGIASVFDSVFATSLALKEKQIQQNYRPVIGVHKWFARRPGTLFRCLMLAEFADGEPLRDSFWRSHELNGVIGDPFMGGGTPIYEANRLGFDVIGCDINPMATWIVRQSLTPLDLQMFAAEARAVSECVAKEIGELYKTKCTACGNNADVKYFIHVKTAPCPYCNESNDLFPGYRLSEAARHPKHVLACAHCGMLNEYDSPPTRATPAACTDCGNQVHIEGNVNRKRLQCRKCSTSFSITSFDTPPQHRMWAIEYHCNSCYSQRPGRQFKSPDAGDLARVRLAKKTLAKMRPSLPIPEDEIPPGDESDRLHRWGYRRYSQMFSERQLLGLGILLNRIRQIQNQTIREAMLTVFSDILRYQNMLCRYDTYALKCQDIFSVHGFPVALVQCENNLLGIPTIGSGSFCHFVEKYIRAKQYCAAPFETRHNGRKKLVVPITGETISARLVERLPIRSKGKQALLASGPSQTAPLAKDCLDGVFTDPPYYDNVQYAELIDFCFVWLRRELGDKVPGFRQESTRSDYELTGNSTQGRGLEHFTKGLSEVFCHFANALKPGRPFVFTYHHNDPAAYQPLVVAILDAELDCTATLPAAAEMTASLHIAGTGSSILDSVFVCRKRRCRHGDGEHQREIAFDVRSECESAIESDAALMLEAGVKLTSGDLRCLLAGHIARVAIHSLRPEWNKTLPLSQRMKTAESYLNDIATKVQITKTLTRILGMVGDSKTIRSHNRHGAK